MIQQSQANDKVYANSSEAGAVYLLSLPSAMGAPSVVAAALHPENIS